MKKVIALVVLSFVVFSCKKAKETAEKSSVVSQVVEIVENDSLTMIEKVEQALSKASDLDKSIISGHYIFGKNEFIFLKEKIESFLFKKNIDLDKYLQFQIELSIIRYLRCFKIIN